MRTGGKGESSPFEFWGLNEPIKMKTLSMMPVFLPCAESLASRNARCLAAMQPADKNVANVLETPPGSFHRLRQSAIDEERFDVISRYDALSGSVGRRRPSGYTPSIL